MARITVEYPEFDVSFDVSSNPEIVMLLAEGSVAEAEALLSEWISGKAVTRPKTSNEDKE